MPARKHDVVVLPWVPQTARVSNCAVMAAKATPRSKIANPFSEASSNSGADIGTAGVRTTTSVEGSKFMRCPGAFSRCTAMPFDSSQASSGLSTASHPDTSQPRFFIIRASPAMPTPPTPTKCALPGFPDSFASNFL